MAHFGNSRFGSGPFREFPIWPQSISGIPNLVPSHFGNSAERHETKWFFGGFTQFYVPLSASRQYLYTWHAYFEKKSDLACFFWQHRTQKQKSATPQGLPPPTQQIKIQMLISWVGQSTRVVHKFDNFLSRDKQRNSLTYPRRAIYCSKHTYKMK